MQSFLPLILIKSCFLSFLKDLSYNNIKSLINKFLFLNQNQIIKFMEIFFIIIKFLTNIIKNIKKIKQSSYFYFIYFLILDLDLENNMISYIIVTHQLHILQLYIIIYYIEKYRIFQIYLSYINLMDNIQSLG